MKVRIPSPLLSYTRRPEVEAEGATIEALLKDLDSRYPGLRFRVMDEQGAFRPHMRFFVNGDIVRDPFHPLGADDVVHIVQALSGG
jgi:molybdopterin converting factor small subunit